MVHWCHLRNRNQNVFTFTMWSRLKYNVYIYIYIHNKPNPVTFYPHIGFTSGVQVIVVQHAALGYSGCSWASGNGLMGTGRDAHLQLASLRFPGGWSSGSGGTGFPQRSAHPRLQICLESDWESQDPLQGKTMDDHEQCLCDDGCSSHVSVQNISFKNVDGIIWLFHSLSFFKNRKPVQFHDI